MKITLQKIKVKDLFNGYDNQEDEGVYAYGGILNVRPKYQREFTYEIERQIKVIETIISGYPLNVMYWVRNKDKSLELLDGQQRTLSICQFLMGEFSIEFDKEPTFFSNFKQKNKVIAEKIENYELMCYFCEDATEDEKLKWFKTINIAGKTLNQQELLNASFTGKWLTEAKTKFSKSKNCPAEREGSNYIIGKPIEQNYLEAALKWISHRDKIKSAEYMALHQGDLDCNDLWDYYLKVINWVKQTFPRYRKEMKGLEWGELYNDHHLKNLDPDVVEKEFQSITNDNGINSSAPDIYRYLISGNSNLLNRRKFDDKIKRRTFEKQKLDKNGDLAKCPDCTNLFKIDEMEGDHIHPWSKGGKSIFENCQMLCRSCNNLKSNH